MEKLAYLFIMSLLSMACSKKPLEVIVAEPSMPTDTTTMTTEVVECIHANAVSVDFQYDLPAAVNESSGLTFMDNGTLWSHNDSGDQASIYQLNPETGALVQSIQIEGATNRDWEAMSYNGNYIYVGDFGNNRGNREDLVIYQIDKTTFELVNSFPFAFAEQTNFNPGNKSHNFNMEAMIATDNQLFLFSKNHLNEQTNCYTISLENTEKQLISPIHTFDSQGLVTDAAYHPATKTLALLGYGNPTNPSSFLWVIHHFDAAEGFGDCVKNHDLGLIEQVEGLTFMDENTLLLTSEKEVVNGGRVYEVKLVE